MLSIDRRKFIKKLGVGLAGTSLLSTNLVSAKSNQAGVQLNFLHGPDDSGTIQAIINKFNREYEGRIAVNWIKAGRLSDQQYRELISEFTVESSNLDVITADIPWTAAFAKNRWVTDLTGKFFRTFKQKDFLESTLNAASYQYKVWGVPWYSDVGMIYYRKDLLEKSGYSSPPNTWDELGEMSAKIVQDEKIENGFVFQGAEYEGGVANALEYIWNSGGRVLTGNISVAATFGQNVIDPNVITINSENAARGLDTARSLVANGISPQSVTEFRELQCSQNFLSGNSVFMRNWPYAYGLIFDPSTSSITKEQVGIWKLPTSEIDGRSYSCQGGWNLMINKYCKEGKIDAAWTFIEYLTSPEQQRFMALNGGFFPTRSDLYDDTSIQQKVPPILLGAEAIRNSRIRPVTPFYHQISPRIAKVFTSTLKGSYNGSEAVTILEKELRTILRKNR